MRAFGTEEDVAARLKDILATEVSFYLSTCCFERTNMCMAVGWKVRQGTGALDDHPGSKYCYNWFNRLLAQCARS